MLHGVKYDTIWFLWHVVKVVSLSCMTPPGLSTNATTPVSSSVEFLLTSNYLPQLEAELSNISQERNDLGEQLTNTQRKKDVLNDELMRLRHRIEQVSETNSRVNKHLEDLVKECEEKQVNFVSYIFYVHTRNHNMSLNN